MSKLRVRFSGLCLFHEQNGEIVARVLPAHQHQPALWFDPDTATATVSGPNADDTKTHCFDEEEAGVLVAKYRKVYKYFLRNSELISFAGGNGGPGAPPGAISLGKIHLDLTDIDHGKPVGAVVRLNAGGFESGPEREVLWNKLPGDTTPPKMVRLWTDLLLKDQNSYTIESRPNANAPVNRSWTFIPKPNEEARVWILSGYDGPQPNDARVAHHFTHQLEHVKGSRHRPYPELADRLPCDPAVAPSRRELNPASAGSSTFCPDSEFP